jgi:hypothetical protein
MNITGILILVVILILIFFLIRYLARDTYTLSTLQPAQTMTTIAPSSLSQSGNGSNSSNFTYSVWFYITNWNYRYGEPKVIFGRMGSASSTTSDSTGVSGLEPCPLVTLGAVENNITISLAVFPNSSNELSSNDVKTGNYVVHNCSIQNVPIQSWVNLLISTYGNILDVYLDGKLVRTCVLPGVAQVNNNSNVYLTPKGGFSGYTSKFQYYPNSTDPQTAWNIYKQGYSNNWWSSIFGGSYQVQVSVLNNGQVQSSFTT